MFRSMGWNEEELKQTESIVREFLSANSDGDIECYLAMEDRNVVGGCALSVQKMLPSSRNRTGLQAYLHNMYVEPEYRGRGIATALLTFIFELCQKRGIQRFSLHASEMGRPLYERIGFEKSDNYYVKTSQGR
jgi:GNAT superfamily N-acetyltransferase